MEAAFDAVYLSFAIVAGIFLVVKGKGSTTVVLFGIMSMILGIGDSFHLVPRVYALFTTGLEANVHSLGIGKLVTSVTMTVFYILLYFIYRMIYEKKSIALDVSMVFLAVLRIVLCLLPGNRWTSADAPLSYGIARNIPFAAIGILLIWLFHRDARKKMDDPLRNMDVAISLSFIFYIPVVLFADKFPPVGMLMIPKTLAYVWILVMGIGLHRARIGCRTVTETV